MKILLVNCVYGYGSTGKIMVDIETSLKKSGVDVIIAYGRGKLVKNSNVFKLAPEIIIKAQSLFAKITGYSYACSAITTRSLFKLIEQEKPTVVNLHCVNANTINLSSTIKYLKRNRIKTVLSLHAEFPYTGGCGHSLDCEKWKNGCQKCPQFKSKGSQMPKSYFFDEAGWQWKQLKEAYNGFDNLLITCVSPWLKERASMSPFFKNKTMISVLNGLDTTVFNPKNVNLLKLKHGLNNEKIILHVTPDFYSTIKGGQAVLEIARRLEYYKEYKIIICGYNGDGSDLPSNVIPIRFTHNQEELAEYYSLADLTLLTSQKETFSMITAESICCGTPIVGYKAGGPESIAMKNHSEFVTQGDIEELNKTILCWIDEKHKNPINIKDAQSLYSKETMTMNYIQAYI